MTPQHHLLDAALDAAARGWPIFPLRPGSKRPAGHPEHRCPQTGRCEDGHRTPEQRATTDPALIRECWSQRPYGIGLATGRAGLVVVDLDVPKEKDKKDAPDGATTFQALCERADQPWPTTYTVRTPSGGSHLYFTTPAGVRLRNTAGKLGPGIDTRAWGGYVVAAGTTTAVGRYEVLHNHATEQLPDWLRTALTPPPPAPAPSLSIAASGAGRATRYAEAALRAETHAVQTAVEGGRNQALTRAARALGRFVAAGQLDRPEVETALKGAAEVCGLPAADARATITSALNWSITHNSPGRAA